MTDRAALLAALDSAAAELPGTSRTADSDGSITWISSGARFAVLHGSMVELRIGMAIAAAAGRTPDTASSGEGPDWIAFEPATLDGHALDRLLAWFAAAHRRASPGS